MSFRTLPRLDHASRRGQMGRRSMPDFSADSAGLEWTILHGELKRVAGITHTVTGNGSQSASSVSRWPNNWVWRQPARITHERYRDSLLERRVHAIPE